MFAKVSAEAEGGEQNTHQLNVELTSKLMQAHAGTSEPRHEKIATCLSRQLLGLPSRLIQTFHTGSSKTRQRSQRFLDNYIRNGTVRAELVPSNGIKLDESTIIVHLFTFSIADQER